MTGNPEIPEGAVEAIQHYFDTQHEFLSWLGFRLSSWVCRYGRIENLLSRFCSEPTERFDSAPLRSSRQSTSAR